MNSATELCVRPATTADIPELVKHRRLMFEELAVQEGRHFRPERLIAADLAYAEYAQKHLADETMFAWIVDAEAQSIASGALTLMEKIPHPRRADHREGYVHSIYTIPAYRHRGLARRIVTAIIACCRSHNLRVIKLNASEAGRPGYEALGFRAASKKMRLTLRQSW